LRKKSKSKMNASLTSSMDSLGDLQEPESIIDRNINLMAHFRDYFLIKIKHMSEITSQQVTRAKSLREKYEIERRERNLYLIDRWALFKKQANEKRVEMERLHARSENARFWIQCIVSSQAMAIMDREVYKLREKKIMKFKRYFKIKKV
jgi:hypothetical protein